MILPSELPVVVWDHIISPVTLYGPNTALITADAVEEVWDDDRGPGDLDDEDLITVYWGVSDGAPVTTVEHVGSLTLPDYARGDET